MAQPLEGIRVLELGQVYNGPYCGMLLAAQGAEIIKIEPPGGEILRRHDSSPGGTSYSFLMLNADKKGVTLNLKSERGREIFLHLVDDADIVLENFRDGVLAGLKIDYETLATRNSRIILASGRGYRPGSTYERFGALDFTVQAISGQMAITGFPDNPPVKAGAVLGDMFGGVHLFAAVLLALGEREQTGRGRQVEVAMLDAMFPSLMAYSSPYLETGVDPGRTGNRHSAPRSGPYGIYPTKDGSHIAITCVTTPHWLAFAATIGTELIDDPELRTAHGRAARLDELDDVVEAWTRTRTRDEIIDLLSAEGVPCAPVRTLAEAVDDPYNLEQGLLRKVDCPGWGGAQVLGSPIQLRDHGAQRADLPPAAPPPQLGEHNDLVYREILGFDERAMEELKADGVI
jgi:CoA:oxalate CoA-transferase